MAYNPELTDRVRQLLDNTPNVSERKMFGSICFMVDGKLAVCAGDHKDYQLLVRVNPEHMQQLLQREGVDKAQMGSRVMKGWLGVDESGLASDEVLRSWVQEALEYNKAVAGDG